VSRLFVAVWPSAQACDHVRALPRDGWTGVRWIPEENWHVTLAFVGEARVDAVVAALTSAALPTARVGVTSHLTLLGRNSLVVAVTGVDALARAVRLATLPGGGDQPFRGHLTIGRSIGKRPITGTSSPAGGPSVEFDATQVDLVTSTLSSQGARYDTVATFPTTVTRPGEDAGER
jgi:2'-5' RNA ligase